MCVCVCMLGTWKIIKISYETSWDIMGTIAIVLGRLDFSWTKASSGNSW